MDRILDNYNLAKKCLEEGDKYNATVVARTLSDLYANMDDSVEEEVKIKTRRMIKEILKFII